MTYFLQSLLLRFSFRNLRPLQILKAIGTLEHLSYKQMERAEDSGGSMCINA